jgi:hypothetical protein
LGQKVAGGSVPFGESWKGGLSFTVEPLGEDLDFEFGGAAIADCKGADGRGCVGAGRNDEIDGFRVVGERDVFGRRLVRVHPVWMRMVDSEEFEATLAELLHEADDLLRRNFVIPGRIDGDVFRREGLRDYAVLARQNSAAFLMRIAPGVFEELPKYFAAALHDRVHSVSL